MKVKLHTNTKLQNHRSTNIDKKLNVKRTIRELFEGFEGEYQEIEIDFGKPVGKEVY